MIKLYIFYNKRSPPQLKITFKPGKIGKIIIMCDSLDSLEKLLLSAKSMKFADKILICQGTRLMSNEEILSYFNTENPPINYQQIAELIYKRLNLFKNKPSDIPAYIQSVSPFKITREDAEKILSYL